MFLRNLFVTLAIIGFLLAGILYYRMYSEPPSPPPIVPPAEKPYGRALVAPGIIEAIGDNVAIGTPESGIVEEVYVKVHDQVKKGDPLFKIDDGELLSQLYVQQANRDAAYANLLRLGGQLERLLSVSDARAVSKEEVSTKKADVLVARAEVERAAAEVKKTELLIRRMTVKAPQDGEILQSNIHPGEFIQASGGSPVMVMGNTTQLQIRADVDEQSVARVRPGQPAYAFLKNNPRDRFPVEFVRIEPYMIPKKSFTGLGEERVDTRVLQVIYRFENNLPFPVFIGQQVDVFIDTGEKGEK